MLLQKLREIEELIEDGAPIEWTAGDIDYLQLDELHDDYSDDLDEINLRDVFDEMARESALADVVSTLSESAIMPLEVSMRGLRALPNPMLAEPVAEAGKDKEKPFSHSNDRWALRRADSLQKGLE